MALNLESEAVTKKNFNKEQASAQLLIAFLLPALIGKGSTALINLYIWDGQNQVEIVLCERFSCVAIWEHHMKSGHHYSLLYTRGKAEVCTFQQAVNDARFHALSVISH